MISSSLATHSRCKLCHGCPSLPCCAWLLPSELAMASVVRKEKTVKTHKVCESTCCDHAENAAACDRPSSQTSQAPCTRGGCQQWRTIKARVCARGLQIA